MPSPCTRLGAATTSYAPQPAPRRSPRLASAAGAASASPSCQGRSFTMQRRQQQQRQRRAPFLCTASAAASNDDAAAAAAASSGGSSSSSNSNAAIANGVGMDSAALPENFCLIESRDSVKDFAALGITEVDLNIESRRNRIFLLMEEVRRLRIQQKIKAPERMAREQQALQDAGLLDEKYPSALPFLPPLSDKTLRSYYSVYAVAVALIVLFGGLIAPVAELRLGIGGTSYSEFIQTVHLPRQLAQVDPIVASFCGGAVGVLSTLLVVEVNNASAQVKRRCIYCEGLGYLTCGNCLGSGCSCASNEGNGAAAAATTSCAPCSGTGKVMCTSCLCTGKQMATEHDPRMDPFA